MASSSIQHQQLQQQQQQGLPSNKHAVLMSASIAFNFFTPPRRSVQTDRRVAQLISTL